MKQQITVIEVHSRIQLKWALTSPDTLPMGAHFSALETICLQCGDRVFTNAFLYCVKCLDVAVHRYCLDVIPEAVNEFVQWVCDDCEVEVQNQPAVRKHDAIQYQTRDRIASKHIIGYSGFGTKKNDIVVVKIEELVHEGGLHQSYDACAKLDLVECAESDNGCYPVGFRGNDELIILSAADERKSCVQSSSQQLEEEKTKDNLMQHDKLIVNTPLKDSMKKESGATRVSTVGKCQHRLGNNSSKRPDEECTNIDISECAKLVSDSMLSTKVMENKAFEKRDHKCFSQQPRESDPEPRTVEHRILSGNGSLRRSKKKKTDMSSEANLEDQKHRTLFAQHLKENKWLELENQCSDISIEGRGVDPSNYSNEDRESEVSKERTSTSHHMSNFCEEFSKDSNISSVVDCHMRAEPVIMPIWRGSFNIWNREDDILDGLVAHMSSRACQKAHEEACQFQPVLHLEMLPRSNVWPKSFETSKPSENIALYFFPSEIRSERVFDHLVDEMMCKELAMKAILLTAELLVFTSTELPLLYWRFEGKYHLWGVFREKQHPALYSQSYRGESR
ncbi:hypothetical protein Pfo_017160 [Paulownia fortunei]|nr:hypothetical protein Pfo_017160 [Paulownia fortunei]